jgi:hypothetical protein
MHLERAEKADDRVRNALAHIGQRPQLGYRGICEPVATIHLFEHAAVTQPLEISSGDPRVVHVPRTH